MASNTPNLGLLKKDPVADGNETFNIKTMLNDNWDKIDEAVGNIKVPDASLTEKGIVQLSSATNSTSENMAATPKAVKTAYDHADTVKTYVDNNYIKKSILLPDGTDMNTLMTEGEYYCPANVNVGTFKNTPDWQACYVKVSRHAGINQTWYVFNPNDNRIFTRNYYPELGWGPWLTMINSSAPWQKRKLTEDNGHCINVNNGNANNLTSTGFYVGENIANAPTTAPGAWWYIEVQAMSSDSWVVQIARDLFVQSGSYRTRIMYNGSWGPWSDDLFQSVVDGKTGIETSIRDKGGIVSKASSVATFPELNAGIDSIPTMTWKFMQPGRHYIQPKELRDIIQFPNFSKYLVITATTSDGLTIYLNQQDGGGLYVYLFLQDIERRRIQLAYTGTATEGVINIIINRINGTVSYLNRNGGELFSPTIPTGFRFDKPINLVILNNAEAATATFTNSDMNVYYG
ncbi:pyocin knob domain-containing protein [Paenibacillus sp. VCA1]|nr:pyocin knob domain-containing protein [Paenibacillus sp. VCA1]MDR9855984.1 pyocin knob domain-containing protein [Paenibacillus sp. VCA1]